MLLCGVGLRDVRCVRWKEISGGHRPQEGGVDAADAFAGTLGILQVRVWEIGDVFRKRKTS